MAQKPVRIQIPEDLDFSALQLARNADGPLSFDWGPIEQICELSGIDVALFRESPEDNIAALLVAWYAEHRQRGGAPDPVHEDLLAELAIEDKHGGGLSHQPGRA